MLTKMMCTVHPKNYANGSDFLLFGCVSVLHILTLYMLNRPEGTKTYIYLHSDKAQVVEIFPHVRQKLTYST